MPALSCVRSASPDIGVGRNPQLQLLALVRLDGDENGRPQCFHAHTIEPQLGDADIE